MEFDNKQFEEGCKESMNTLDKLKQKINDSSSGDALNGLNKVDFSNLEKSVDKIADRFTFLGNLAFKIKDKIADAFLGAAKTLATTVPNIIKEGGWQRALNIEDAKFQLEGLKVAWEDIADDINYAVDGTAYGLDAAAKAASQLVASGVQVGDSMKNALRAISGVAAMTNSEYEAIAPIFTTVAGQGKVMTMQLRQLENRGLNAAATMADYFKGVMDGSIEASDSIKSYVATITEQFGYGEAAVREMVSEGVIDFNTFSNAMDNAFGEHAKDANRTFKGVTANIRAALKKIGADFATPILEQDGPVVQALQKLRERINDVRKSLGPLTSAWTDFVYTYAHDAKILLQNMDMSFMENVAKGLANAFKGAVSVLDAVRYAFADVFLNSKGVKGINDVAAAFAKFTEKMILSKAEMEDLRSTVRGVLSAFSIVTTVIKQILGALLNVKPETISIRAIILNITGLIGDLITYMAQLIKQTNIVGPIINGLATGVKILVAVLVTAIGNIASFISYISKLEVTRKIINGLELAVKALAVGLLALGVAVKNILSSAINKIPGVLATIKNEIAGIVSYIGRLNIVQKAVAGINKLVESIHNLLHPKDVQTSELKKTVTIVDEAVALAGPPQVAKVQKMSTELSGLAKAMQFVKDAASAIIKPVKDLINFLGVGGITALAFTAAIFTLGIKLLHTVETVNNTFRATTSVLKTLGSDGIVGLIFGKRQPVKIPFLIQLSVAIASLAASMKLLSTIESNKLKEVGTALAGMAVGLGALVTVMTISQKVIGKGEFLTVASSFLMISAAIGIMSGTFLAMTKLMDEDTAKLQAAGSAIAKLGIVFTGMAVVLGKLAPSLSASALSLVGMAVSMRILVGAIKALDELTIQVDRKADDYNQIWGKTGLLVALAGGLVIVSGLASKLGTNSLLGIMVALLSLKAIVPLANSVAEAIKDSIFADAWNKLVDFWAGMPESLKKIGPYILAALSVVALIVGVVYAFKKLKAALADIGNMSNGMTKDLGKLAGLQKALARLSLVPVIIALTGMMVAIAALVVVIGKINIPNLKQAAIVMGIVAVMFGTLAGVVAASKNAKPGAVIGAMVGMMAMFSELIVLSLLIEQHYVGVLAATAVMAIVMHHLADLFTSISTAAAVNGKTLAAIGLVAAIVAELGVVLYSLAQQDWKSVAASGASMSLALMAFAKAVTMLGATGQSWTKNKFIAIAECTAVLVTIGIALSEVAKQEWKSIAAAGASMSAAMLAFGAMVSIIGKASGKFDPTKLALIASCAVVTVTIGAALALATLSHDWKSIAAAGASMSVTMLAFAAMATMLGNMSMQSAAAALVAMVGIATTALAIGAAIALVATSHDWKTILASAGALSATMLVFGGMAVAIGALGVASAAGAFVAMLGISAAALAIGASLAMLAQYPWSDILIAAGVMVATIVLLGAATAILGVLSEVAIPGAIALDLLAVAILGISTAFAVFITALNSFLPVASEFLYSVLGTLVEYAESLPQVGSGLISLAVGLAAVGAAGVVLAVGSAGLLAAGTALQVLVPAIQNLAAIDFATLAVGLAEFVIPAALIGPLGLLAGVGAPGFALAAVAIAALAVAIGSLAQVLTPGLNQAMESFTKKAEAAKTWGKDLIKNFIDGIKAKLNDLKKTVNNVAQTVADYLHFTTPDKGPLADFDSSGSDMMQTFIDGINSSSPELMSTLNSVAGDIEGEFEGIDLASIGNNLGIDLGSNTLSGASPYIQQLKNQLTNIQNQIRSGYQTISKNGNVNRGAMAGGPSLLTQKLIDERKAAKDTSTALDDYSNSAGKAGGSSKSAANDVKDLSDAFKTAERGTKVNLSNMINNLLSNQKATAEWARDMKLLMGKGFDKSITDWIKKMGVGGHETVKAFMNASQEEVATLNANMQRYLTLDANAEKYILGQYEEFGGQIVQILADSVATYDTKLAETIQNAVSPFKEFDKKTELTGDKMLANMRSQITGITEWSNNVTSLIGRVPDELIQYFQDLGPASYEEVNAMAHMTEGQLNEAVELWTAQLALGQTLAMQQAQKYREVGQAVTDGLTEGVNFDQANADGTRIGDEMIKGTKTALDSHSPSRVFHKIGEDTTQGLTDGIKVTRHIPINNMIMLSNDLINETKRIINWGAGNDIAGNLIDGLKHGITSGESGVINAIEEMAKNAIAAANRAFDIHSPSKVFREMGLFIDKGLAQGIDWGTEYATSATQRMGNTTIQMMNDIIKNISEEVNDSPEFQPVIRPELDLTALQNGKSSINALLGDNASFATGRMASGIPNTTRNINVSAHTSNSDVVSAINSLRDDVGTLRDRVTNMQVLLDGKTVVGELAPAMDVALGRHTIRAERRN